MLNDPHSEIVEVIRNSVSYTNFKNHFMLGYPSIHFVHRRFRFIAYDHEFA